MKTTSLAAVLYSQIAGFELLMNSNNTLALQLLARYQALVAEILPEHSGELVDVTGDEDLIIFNSAVHAVQFALHLELAVKGYNRGQPDSAERFLLSVGVHLGEIWREGQRVYGNGVNIGARVKQAALPGMILVSEDVERQVANKLDVEFFEVVDRVLKNIKRPLRLYAIGDCQAELRRAASKAEADSLAVALARVEGDQAVQTAADQPVSPEPDSRAWQAPTDVTEEQAAGGSFSLTIGTVEPSQKRQPAGNGATGDERRCDGATSASQTAVRLTLEEKVDRLKAVRIKALVAIARSLLVGAAFGWAYLRYENAWLFVGAMILGLLPLLGATKRFLATGPDLKQARKAIAAPPRRD